MRLRQLRRTLAAVCAAAAGLTSAGIAAAGPAHAAAAAPPALSVFAWNVDLATAAVDSTQNENAAGRAPTVEAIIRAHGADVVILDELFNHASTSSIISSLSDLYPYRTPWSARCAPAAAGPGSAATARTRSSSSTPGR